MRNADTVAKTTNTVAGIIDSIAKTVDTLAGTVNAVVENIDIITKLYNQEVNYHCSCENCNSILPDTISETV